MLLPLLLVVSASCHRVTAGLAGPAPINNNFNSQRADGWRRLATLGLLFGAIETEAAIERRLASNHPPPEPPGTTLARGRLALEVLGTGLELAAADRPLPSAAHYRRELRKRSQDSGALGSHETLSVQRQVVLLRQQLADRIRRAVRALQRSPTDSPHPLPDTLATLRRALAPIRTVRFEEMLQNGLKGHIEKIFQRGDRRQDDGGSKSESKELAVSVDVASNSQQQQESESESSEEDGGDGPGGLVGLIASLSGGDEGSDVGALIGTLSALVTNLFGPGGLDVPGLLGTGTSLIAGLLAGDENFGKVLGSYVGVAIEGLSGGGADLNGAFFGNFLGAVLAALSSDPEDDNLPLKPALFVENFFSGLQEAKRKDDPKADGGGGGKGSDLFGFIGHIVSSVVGGITSLVLNASLGSSGGSSQGSADASGASSAGSSGGGHHPDATEGM
ncbi:uncharacterized protein LOC131213427 [Anopheles bellator]|uniref:uncharacterized protein LOC131213427 n=1 Tax=Anopheles bellator TaxID=139047 RepID=UPI002647937D|nr:uncharacterized protein LOC131213427 [Anopheles bellator]